MTSADTNLFIYAADPDSTWHRSARDFFKGCGDGFVVSQFVLVEVYMLLRNPAVFRKPYSTREAVEYCRALAGSPKWRCVDYDPMIAKKLWQWAEQTERGYRGIIDARIGLILRHHGVTHFATANVKDFEGLGFEKVWNPLTESP
ncbi:MAG: PIN domain-containing protein [Verrucomicrobiota bacterium]